MSKSTRIYLDYAASTPVDKEVIKAMEPYFVEKYGNPGSLHSFGQEALAAIDHARETIAKGIGAEFNEIIFTGSATEANNLALRGAVHAAVFENQNGFVPRIVVSSVEHESVLETARNLEKDGVDVVYVPVGKDGIVEVEKIEEALDERTILVSVMHASNEIGTIQPIEEISGIIRNWKSKIKNPGEYPLFHTDAAQTFHLLNCDVCSLGVDMMTLSSQKMYGPKGVGALYIRSGIQKRVSPIITGGGHEYGLRAGTQNVPAIVGFGIAVERAIAGRERERETFRTLKTYLLEGLRKLVPDAEVNGAYDERSLPSILNVYFPKRRADELLIKFDEAGIEISAGSACSARAAKPSHVLGAIGYSKDRVMESVRFSFGKPTTQSELSEALKRIWEIFR